MAGYNRAIVAGNVGQDPQIKSFQSGDDVANFSIATSEKWTDKNSGETKERTEWHRVACYNPHLNKIIAQYVKKGSKVLVEGQLQTRKWTDQSGVEKYTTEIVLTKFKGELTLMGDGGGRDDRREDDAPRRAPSAPAQQRQAAPSWDARRGDNDLDDEIPF